MRNAYFALGVVVGALTMVLSPGLGAFVVGFAIFAFVLN